jgi:cytochrome b involved in lipid metabolism
LELTARQKHTFADKSLVAPDCSTLLPKMSKEYTLEEVSKHTSEDDCWIVIHGKVYDVTDFLDSHPGGPEYLTDFSGGNNVANIIVLKLAKPNNFCR